jgi:hypothetical protein
MIVVWTIVYFSARADWDTFSTPISDVPFFHNFQDPDSSSARSINPAVRAKFINDSKKLMHYMDTALSMSLFTLYEV